MELRIDLPERYQVVAARMYEEGDLVQVNRVLQDLGIHISFATNFQPKNARRPQSVVIYAEDRREW